ncbi:hypothetical protein C1646_670449 [Rhizophagus diaphanus]|nr:hypothetical protein C1646_670449 [Rhizophagus diaphanus] [Rhizophagus sp. MUCL 43196]
MSTISPYVYLTGFICITRLTGDNFFLSFFSAFFLLLLLCSRRQTKKGTGLELWILDLNDWLGFLDSNDIANVSFVFFFKNVFSLAWDNLDGLDNWVTEILNRGRPSYLNFGLGY